MSCGFVYMRNCADYTELSENISWSKQFAAQKVERQNTRPVFDYIDQKTRWRLHLFPRPETYRFTNQLVARGNVVDLGCSAGANLMRLHHGLKPFGVEIEKLRAQQADEVLKTRDGSCVHAPAIEGLERFADDFFHGAMLNSFLEHESQPLKLLRVMRDKIRPDGVCIVKVPNCSSINAKIMKSSWCGIRIPDHVNYFTPKSLATLAAKAKFRCEFPAAANLPTNDNFWTFLRPI